MKILLVYPGYPDTFWSFRHALKMASKKAPFPPLGLLTVAAMLPDEWDKKLVDMNVRPFTDDELRWADYVFLSAMIIQKDSARHVIARCKHLGVKVVAGGPLFTCEADSFDDVLYRTMAVVFQEYLAVVANADRQRRVFVSMCRT